MFFNKLKALVRGFGLIAGTMLMIYGAISVLRYAGTAYGAPAMQGGGTLTSVPKYLNYQGTLRDPEGNLMSGLHNMTFRIYDRVSASQNEAVWVEAHDNVTVRDGQFSVLLGNNTPLPLTIFYGPDTFIGVTVAPFDEMVPRQRFASVPYAIYADHASSLTQPDGENNHAVFVDTEGKVGVGTDSPVAHLEIVNTSGATETIQIKKESNELAIDPNSIQSSASLNINTDTNSDLVIGGKVGIGIAPAASLHVKSADPDMILDATEASTGITQFNFSENGTSKASFDYFRNTDELSILSQGVNAMTFDGANVGIGTQNPTRKLHVSGDANVTGNLIFGSLTGFIVSNVVNAEGNNGTNANTILMSASNSICFLTKTVVRNADTESEDTGCEVYKSGTSWRLRTWSSGDANAFCSAICLSWD